MGWEPEDIEKMRREDQSRGKKPQVPEGIYREKIKKLKDLRNLLEEGDFILFKKALNMYGLKDKGQKNGTRLSRFGRSFTGPGNEIMGFFDSLLGLIFWHFCQMPADNIQ